MHRYAAGMHYGVYAEILITDLPVQRFCLTYYLHMHGDNVGKLYVIGRPSYNRFHYLETCKYILHVLYVTN